MRVAAHPHRHHLDQRGPVARPRTLGGPGERGGDLIRIGAVDGDAGNAVAGGLVRKDARRGILAHRRGERGLVVLQTEDRGQLRGGARIDRLVPLAERRPAFADERERDSTVSRSLFSSANAIAMPAIDSEPTASGAAAGSTPQSKSPVCRSLPSIGGPALPICARRIIADRFFVVTHRERHAEIANHRRQHIAAPGAVALAIAGAAMQADRARVDRFLPERAEALALKRHLAPAHFPAHEELLEAVVDAARQAHALQDLAPFGLGERGLDRGTPQETVARINQLGTRLLEPLDGGCARRGFGHPWRRRHLRVQHARERAPERHAGRIELHRIARLDGADAGFFKRLERHAKRKRIAFGDEGAEAAGEARQTGDVDRA